MVGRAQQRSLCGTRGIHEPFKLKRGDNVRMLGILELVILCDIADLVSGCNNDCAVLFFNNLVLLIEVDSLCRAVLFAKCQ